MKKVRTAVVGLNMGLAHAHAYARAQHSELKYVVDLDEEKAAKTADELGCKYATDWESILDEIDAVSICTPHHLHYPQAMKAISEGKHVLVEKPLANSEQECLELIEAADENNVKLMVAYVVRYLPAVRKLKEAIDSGKYGEPIHAQGWVNAFLPPMPNTWFARKETLGGGVLFSHGCHYIDILVWLFGEPKEVFQLGTRNGTDWLEGEGTSHSTIKFANGVLGSLSCSWGTKIGRPPAKYQIHMTEGLLILSNNMWEVEAITSEGSEILYKPSPDAEQWPGRNVSYEIDHFLDSIVYDKTPETDGRDAMLSHRVIWSMYESKGMPVNVKVNV